MSTPPYHVQSTATRTRDGFPWFTHHDSVAALWAEKWRAPFAAGIYPFTDGEVGDVEPVFAELARIAGDVPDVLRRPDDYAAPFLAPAQRLVTAAEEAETAGDVTSARNLYLRAAAVYRIARFPVPRSPLGREAWARGTAAYDAGGRYLDPPSHPVAIGFGHADTAAGDSDDAIRAYLRLPAGPPPDAGRPVLLFVCGLDAYRTDHTPRTQAHVDRGYATLSVEIPGTGDCPAAPHDPDAPDRLLSSVLDWVEANATQYAFDPRTVVLRGISTGGYHAIRAAHTHGDRLVGAVAHGGACHHMFDAAWIRAQNQMEYPFALADALAHKFGYRDPDPDVAVARYAEDAQRFSLLDGGILARPGCRLLAVNGVEDSIFPIEDSMLAALHGDRTDLVARAGLGHMGNPGAEELVHDWIDDVVARR